MIIRLTQKLAAKLGETPTTALPRDPDLFADWTANLFTANRVLYIIRVISARDMHRKERAIYEKAE